MTNNSDNYQWFFDAYEEYCAERDITPQPVPHWLRESIKECIDHNFTVGRSPHDILKALKWVLDAYETADLSIFVEWPEIVSVRHNVEVNKDHRETIAAARNLL